jgi:hypothetical protein
MSGSPVVRWGSLFLFILIILMGANIVLETAHQLRKIRNFGAHNAEYDLTEEDVPVILDFIEVILEYLYIAPAKIAAVQARLKKTP